MRHGFLAKLCNIDKPSTIRQEQGGIAWRAAFSLVDRPQMAVPVPFACQRDAQAAAAWCAARIPQPESMTLSEFCAAWDSICGSMQATADLMVADCCRIQYHPVKRLKSELW